MNEENSGKNLPLNVHWNSADAMQTILGLYFPQGKILDVNHSLGVFYRKLCIVLFSLSVVSEISIQTSSSLGVI